MFENDKVKQWRQLLHRDWLVLQDRWRRRMEWQLTPDQRRAWAAEMVELADEMNSEMMRVGYFGNDNVAPPKDFERLWRNDYLAGKRIAKPIPQDKIKPMRERRIGYPADYE